MDKRICLVNFFYVKVVKVVCVEIEGIFGYLILFFL